MSEKRPLQSPQSPLSSLNLRELLPATQGIAYQHPAGAQALMDSRKEHPARRKSKQVSEACDLCRRKKAKCSGPPRCESCVQRNTECTFLYHDMKRQSVTREEYENLRSRLQQLEATLEIFKFGTEEQVEKELQRLRKLPSFSDAHDESMAVDDEGAVPFQSAVEGLQGQDGSRRESTSQDCVPGGSRALNVEIFHEDHLPREEDVRAAVSASGNGPADLFFIITPAECDELLQRVYRAGSENVTKADICMLCALAAYGSHFASDSVSDRSKQSLFRTALALLPECYEVNDLHGLRSLLCLALFAFIEKRSGFRVTLASGLQIARWTRSNAKTIRSSVEGSEDFRQVYRSLVLLDSYLAVKIACSSTVSTEESNFVVSSEVDKEPSGADVFGSKLNALARFMRSLPSDLYSMEQYGLPLVSSFMQTLASWQHALPDSMRLAALTTPDQSNVPNGMPIAILFLHETYLSIVVQVHRGLIPAILEERIAGLQWSVYGTLGEVQEYYRRTMTTAQQCIRANTLLAHRAGPVFRQCWLLLCEVFICSCLVLADTALSILAGASEGVQESLQWVRDGMDTITYMQSMDQMAANFLGNLQPLYQGLNTLHKAGIGTSSVGGTPVPEAGVLLQQAVQVLKDINQHKSKQSLASASSSSGGVPDWW